MRRAVIGFGNGALSSGLAQFPPRDRGVLLSIQYLRVVAALGVVLSHIAGHAHFSLQTGAAGVDIFFVISGFIMWTVTAQRPVPPGRFMLDRVTRIAPPYVLLTAVVYLAARHLPDAFPDMRTSLHHAVLSMLFIPHRDPYGTAFPLIIPGWTLIYEMFFYAVFALALLAPRARRAVLCSCVLAALVVLGASLHSRIVAVDTYTNPLLLEFVAGLWLGVAWQSDRLPGRAWAWLALLLGAAALLFWHLLAGFQPDAWRAIIWGLPATMIVGGVLALERRGGIPRSRLLLLLGNASYSIYLTNVFIIAAASRVLGKVSVPLYLVAAVVAVLAGGVVFWHLIERPLTHLSRQLIRRPSPVVEASPSVL
jgi:exopolysaccharide production protein ExoZ